MPGDSPLADATSNIDEIAALLLEVPNILDFTHPGENRLFGTDLLDTVADAIAARCDRQQDPDGTSWPANDPDYMQTEEKKGKPIGVLTGEMLSMPQLKGERVITSNTASMTYGTEEFPKKKAQWFTNGSIGDNVADEDAGEYAGGDNQPSRRFYALDADIETVLTEMCEEQIARRLEHLGG